MRHFLTAIILLASCVTTLAKPWLGLHVIVETQDAAEKLKTSIEPLAVSGVNVLIVEVNYSFEYRSHPELTPAERVTRRQAAEIAALCKKHNIRVIPEINCLGHQSWAKSTHTLLTKYPELDETPGKYPENKDIYCRSWCPSHPKVNQILFPLIDELMEAFESDGFHVGMDEVFIIADKDCPRCAGKDPAKLYADQVNSLHNHIVGQRKGQMFMWADRLLDAKEMGLSTWEASANGTAPAIDLIPKDIVLCDWHYEKMPEYKSVPFLLNKGFAVWPTGWNKPDGVTALVEYSLKQQHPKMLGYLSTTWHHVPIDKLADFDSTKIAARKLGMTSEPGVAESQVKADAGDLIKVFTHPTTEVRGVWFARNDMEGATRDELKKKLDALKAANFNTILIDTWFQGYVPYPDSAFVPLYPKFADQPDDLIAFLVKESKARSLRVDLWPSYGFYAYFTPDVTKDKSRGALLDKHPELTAVDDNGQAHLHRSFGDYYSLCPSNPESHQLLADLFAEQVKRYDVDGLSLDRIRYPEENYCHCDYCKTHFKQDTGIELKTFPTGSPESTQFLQWRREQTVKAVATIRQAALKARPGISLTAYVLSPAEFNSKAQGWDLWMKQDLLDAVAVSMYGPDPRDTIRAAVKLLDGRTDKLLCALSAEMDPDRYASNIERGRGARTLGQFTWFAAPALKSAATLSSGPYARPAASPLAKSK